MSKGSGFLLTCVLLPGLYAGLAYYLCESGQVFWPPYRSHWFALLVGIPVFVGGIAKWFDVWGHDHGMASRFTRRTDPKRFVGILLVANGVVFAVLGLMCIGQGLDAEKHEKFVESFRNRDTIRRAAFEEQSERTAADIERLQLANSGIYWGLGYTSGPNFFNNWAGVAVVLAAVLWGGYTPGRRGFDSGQSIGTGGGSR